MENSYDVLIIDDNIDDYELCQHMLCHRENTENQHTYFRLRHAKTGQQGLSEINARQPDCVLLDYSLPSNDGLTVLQEIKKHYIHLPVVMLTGQGNEKLAVSLLKAGAHDYISKSEIHNQHLGHIILQAINSDRSASENTDKKDEAFISILVVDDNEDDRELVRRTLSKVDNSSYRFIENASGKNIATLIEGHRPNCILLDYSLPGENGLVLLNKITSHHPYIPVIIFSGQGSEHIAAEAIKNGAFHYLVKCELTPELLDTTIRQGIEKKRLERIVDEKNQEIKRHQHESLERKQRYDRVIKATNIVVWEYDMRQDQLYIGEQVSALTGESQKAIHLPLKQWHEQVHKDDLPKLSAYWQTYLQDMDGEHDIAYRIRHQSGSWRWIREVGNVVLRDASGQPSQIAGLFQDITEHKEAESRLAASEERYELAVRGSSVGLWDWDVKSGELFWSDRFKQIIGISDTDFRPRYEEFSERLHPDDKDRIEKALFSHVEKGTPYDVEYRLRRTDDTYVWIHARGQAIWDEQGHATRMAGSVDDISKSKLAQEEIMRSNMELERFAYMASHDLQEPLRMVINFTQLLERYYDDKLDARAHQYIQYACDGASRMQHLVQDLLEYARIGNEAESYSVIDLNSLKESIEENLAVSIKQTGTHIKWQALPSVLADPSHIRSVFQNLIGNAIKYRKPDVPPQIEITVTSSPNDQWVFSVNDNGIGMKQAYCEKIFEPFKRLHLKEEYAGTGIGLSICRKTVEGLGGTIWATSELERGSTFYFSLPKIKSDHQARGLA